MVQPPIPAGDDPALVGTDTWKTWSFSAHTRKARLMWASTEDVKQAARDPYWPPNVHPYTVGLWLEDAVLEVGKAEEWRDS